MLHFYNVLSEMELRTQGSRPRPRTQKKIRGQGQSFRGQILSRPRTEMLETKAKDTKASVLQKKGLQNFFSGHLQKKKEKSSTKIFPGDFKKKKTV